MTPPGLGGRCPRCIAHCELFINDIFINVVVINVVVINDIFINDVFATRDLTAPREIE